MSQIYKVFFKNISFEIKPFSKIDSKLECIIFFHSFNEFISSVHDALINNESCQKRLILKSNNIQNDWESLINNLRKFEFIIAAGGLVENNSKEWLFSQFKETTEGSFGFEFSEFKIC